MASYESATAIILASIGISASAVTLMMPTGTVCERGHLFDRTEDLGSEYGVSLDDLELFLVELGGLVDNGIGDTDLAYIMQKSHHVDGVLLLVVVADPSCYFAGVSRNTAGMTVRVGILCIDRFRESFNDMQEKLAVLLSLLVNLVRERTLQV